MTRIFAESIEKVEVSGVATDSSSNPTRITKASMGNIYAGMGVSYKTGASAATIPDNSYITSTSHSSNYVTMNNNSGQTDSDHTVIFNKSNVNVPTNPKFRTFGAYSGSERLYTIIYEQPPSATETFIQQATVGETEHSNLETTEGFRIKNYSSILNEGYQLNTADLTTDNYFVLIHSDDHLKHHFAKITEINADDVAGDSFDFEPRLGTEISEGTKFMIFKGPPVSDSGRNCKILAVSAGIKMDLQDSLICSSPLFYFFNDNLDKDNQLDHNIKYFMKFIGASNTGASTVNKTRTPSIKNTFVTSAYFQNKIKDYSKFSMNISLTDNLKKIDSPDYYLSGNAPLAITNEFANGDTLTDWTETTDFTDYNECFPNARRDTDNDVFNTDSLDTLGPIRYIHYDFSPTRANKLYNVIDLQLEESIGSRGTYAEMKAVDTKRILPIKTTAFDDLRIRHRLHKGKFNDWFALKAFIKARVGTTNEYTFTTEYDLATMFNVGDEVKIGDIILIVDTIDAINNSGASGKEQDITFRAETRPDNSEVSASKFASSSYVLAESAVIYRRAWNSVDSTLLTSFDLIENRNNNLYVKLISGNFGFLEATVTASDRNKEMLTLDFTTTNRSISSLDYMEGSYYIEVEKFSGSIEKIGYYKENGQTIMDIAGRSDIRKLLGPIINKNTLHSQDMIYSTKSPYSVLTKSGITDAKITSASFTSTSVTVSDLGGALTNDNKGVLLFAYTAAHGHYAYLGELQSVSSNTITLRHKALMEIGGLTAPTDSGITYNYELYYSSTTHYMFNKSLSANTKTSTVSTLSGSSSKGLYFNGGYSINTNLNGLEGSELVNTSANTVNAESLGYYISSVKGVKESPIFEARLDDNKTNTGTQQFSTFDTVNTLLDFTVVSTSSEGDNTVIELAPYIPLTLGRVDINHANLFDTDFSTTTLGTVYSSNVGEFYFRVENSSSTEALSGIANTRKYHGEPVYADNNGTVTYLGKFIQADMLEDGTTHYIYVSKPLPIDIDGQTIKVLNYQTDGETSHKTHEMNFLNGAHLHGGKTIMRMPCNFLSISESSMGQLAPFNYSLYQGAPTEEICYVDKYGSPHYRIFNIEHGDYNKTTDIISSYPTNALYYSESFSKIKYYANSYRGVGHNSILHSGKTGKNADDSHILPESRGWFPASGSRFWDKTIYYSGETEDLVGLYPTPATSMLNGGYGYVRGESPYTAKDNMNFIDPKIARMFLFVNSDIMGYSSNRNDSLLHPTLSRNITGYNIMLLNDPSTTDHSDNKEGVLGTSKNINFTDSHYTSGSISSCDTDVSSLKQFSIMRLTEMVVDYSFNQIDPENTVNKSKTYPIWYYNGKSIQDLSAAFTGNGPTTANFVSDAIECDNDPSSLVSVRDIIYDARGRYIGQVDSTTATASTGGSPAYKINLANGPIKTNAGAYVNNETIYVVPDGAMPPWGGGSSAFTTQSARIEGHGPADTFAGFDNANHMLKTMVARRVGTSYYGESGAFEDYYGNGATSNLGEGGGNSHRDPNLWLPVNMDATSVLGDGSSTINWHPSLVFEKLKAFNLESESNDCSAEELLYKGMLPLFLDRFKVENADGAQASKGMVGQPIMGSSFRKIAQTSFKDLAIISMKTQFDFAKWEDESLESNSHADGKTADGVLMGFKPRLYINEDVDFSMAIATDSTAGSGTTFGTNPKIIQVSSTATLRVGMQVDDHSKIPANSYITQIDDSTLFRINNDVNSGATSGISADFSTKKRQIGGQVTYNYVIDTSEEIAVNSLLSGTSTAEGNVNRMWLDLVNDLTGCYLVSEKGKYYDDSNSVQSYSTNLVTNPSLNNQTPDIIAYIISHEIDTTNTASRHIITTDKELDWIGWYRIMQPNHTCFYSHSPKEIRLNELSSKYTKINGENACYTEIQDYTLVDSAGKRTLGTGIGSGATADHNNTGGQEAALSMYILVGVDQTDYSNTKPVVTDVTKSRIMITGSTTAGLGLDTSMVLSDGDNFTKTSVKFTDNSDDIGFFLTFGNLPELNGVVSISETFNVTVDIDVSDAKRALIGTGTTICNEAEDLINTLMEENDIEFTSTPADYPLFLAPNYQGVDLFSAINDLLAKKNKVLFHDNDTFQIKDKDDASFYTGVLIKDTGDTEIYDYEKSENMFDLYNEIIVYGKFDKSTRRQVKSINQVGKKTLEVYDDTLKTQEEVDTKALQLLMLHTDLNQKITVTLGHKNVSQIRAGDIVELEISRENIHRNQHIVLQVEHLLQGNMKLELGRYSKQLEDRFAELAIQQKNIRANIRNSDFDTSTVYNTFLEEIKLKPMRLLIRERKSNGGATLGFGTTLNTTVRPLGHTGGIGVTITDLLGEDY